MTMNPSAEKSVLLARINPNLGFPIKVFLLYRRDPLIGDFFVSQFSQKSPNSGPFQFCRSLIKT